MRFAFPIFVVVAAVFGAQSATGEDSAERTIAATEAKMAQAKWIHVSWAVRPKPDRIGYVEGKPIRDPAVVKLIRDEVARLLRLGRPAIQGRDGPRDFPAYWCSATVTFVLDDPSKPFGIDSNNIEVCGRPGRFMTGATKKFPHLLMLEHPRHEIQRFLSLAGIKELPDCPEPPRPPVGRDYEDFNFQCW